MVGLVPVDRITRRAKRNTTPTPSSNISVSQVSDVRTRNKKTKKTTSHNFGRLDANTTTIIRVSPPVKYPLPLEISFRGVGGLGHRLFRQSNAYHLAKALYLDSITVDWGWCYTFGDSNNLSHVTSYDEIFPYLFGNTSIQVLSQKGPSNTNELLLLPTVSLPFVRGIQWNNTELLNISSHHQQTLKLGFVNEVWQYNERQQNIRQMKRQWPPFYGKDRSDLEMYQILRQRFQYHHRVEYWKRKLEFSTHMVVGLHIREGNGESGDFQRKKRGIQGLTLEEWMTNLATLLVNFTMNTNMWNNHTGTNSSKPPLILLATDSSNATGLSAILERDMRNAASRIQQLTGESNISAKYSVIRVPKMVVAQQERVPAGRGASYQYAFETKEKCLESWVSQMVDMFLLAESDVVVAGQYSSFTQTIPLSFQFAKAAGTIESENNHTHGRFCNVGTEATVMECFQEFEEWMSRKSSLPLIGDPHGRKQDYINLIPFPVPTMTLRNALRKSLKTLPVEIMNLV